jgi:hypothetical protein
MERQHEMEFRSGRHRGLINPSHQKTMGDQYLFLLFHVVGRKGGVINVKLGRIRSRIGTY